MLLYQLKHDEDVIGRIQAAQNLAKLGAPDCIEALKNAIVNDTFWGVQAEAARALGTIKSETAMSALMECSRVSPSQGSARRGGCPGRVQGGGRP